eukprot:CAMPEP_0180172092 /NCGR_PEP_ID=MMETSP0986-20121125/34812_1 /TAXON_ID=697907 /ORGANISM="non described non described, Strain CCMP2293" /LENGTH=37 /DNA_ID= /DNA_START= /DNA_END= /DNA_ORIENTATION=
MKSSDPSMKSHAREGGSVACLGKETTSSLGPPPRGGD